MSRNPLDWPVKEQFLAVDTSQKEHRITVRQRPESSGTALGGETWHAPSEIRAFFLDNGIPLNADPDNEGVFTVVGTNQTLRKI